MVAQSPDKILDALRNIPLWLLSGLALASFGLLFFPGFGGVDPALVRKPWGAYFWGAAILFSTLAIAKAIAQIAELGRTKLAVSSLVIVPTRAQCQWKVIETKNGFITQLDFRLRVTNLLSEPVRLLDFQIVSPQKWKGAQATNILLADMSSDSYASVKAVQSRQSADVVFGAVVEGSVGRPGKPMKVVILLADQLGNKNRQPVILLPSSKA